MSFPVAPAASRGHVHMYTSHDKHALQYFEQYSVVNNVCNKILQKRETGTSKEYRGKANKWRIVLRELDSSIKGSSVLPLMLLLYSKYSHYSVRLL